MMNIIKDSSRWVVTLIRGLYKPHKGPLPLYEPYMSLIWGYPPGNYPPETVPDITAIVPVENPVLGAGVVRNLRSRNSPMLT